MSAQRAIYSDTGALMNHLQDVCKNSGHEGNFTTFQDNCQEFHDIAQTSVEK